MNMIKHKLKFFVLCFYYSRQFGFISSRAILNERIFHIRLGGETFISHAWKEWADTSGV
jgi:hypothetical protein